MNVSRNPENPFVYNANYWANASAYNGSILHFIHKANNFAAFVIGIFLVCLLTYLILTKTPLHFKPYSKILLLCVFNDSIILLVHIMLQCRVKVINAIIFVSIAGPLSFLPYPYNGRFMAFQGLSATIAMASLPLQYYYRFMTLKLKRPPSLLRTFFYYLVLLTFDIIFVFMCGRSYSPDISELEDVDHAQFWYEEKPVPYLAVGSFLTKWMFCTIIYLSIFLGACYGLIIWFARETVKELNAQEYILTARTLVLQAQFSKTLLIQALTPLITCVFPLLFVCFAMATNSSTGYAGELIILALTWFPVLNSSSNIILIGPYRMHCLKILFKYKLLSSSASSMLSNSVMDSSHLASISAGF